MHRAHASEQDGNRLYQPAERKHKGPIKMPLVVSIMAEMCKTTLITAVGDRQWLVDHIGPPVGTAVFLHRTLHVTAHTIACIRPLQSLACIHEHHVVYTAINSTGTDERHKWVCDLFLCPKWSPEDDACVPLHSTT